MIQNYLTQSIIVFHGKIVLKNLYIANRPLKKSYFFLAFLGKELSLYSTLSIKACQLASIIFSDTPTVPHLELWSPDSISTRVLACVPF